MYDTLLHRYGDIGFIMALPMDEGLQIYTKAIDRNVEKFIWEKWLVDYQRMTPDNFVPFSEYLRKAKEPPKPKDNRSDEEILADADDILKMMKRSE
ncbi:hypothetical protein [Mesobacillus sp. S13]|uniref:hypothetical protein n=1 Tax=Mesobacillus sp. S13 TaxID=2880221 RepID=UPI001CF509A2|nr:hypothetical protein [Mesobacillus sp. S13]